MVNLIFKEIQKENKAVFKKFFEKHYESCVIYANGYLFDKASSEDIVQEVFVYLWENATHIEINTSLKGYLFRMVRNRCLNYLKSVKLTDSNNFLDFNVNLITEEIFDSNTDEDKDFVYQELLNIIESLPEKMQQIVKLKFLHGYKYKEIANEMDISINTVKTQLKRAKARIAELVTLLLLTFQNI